ncbi:hypothetical protein Zmor_023251 [Zophobas morio]|uniref:Uncharacterized protein n=1 Tax=Zophobas morio TaxID=2755281 RepID=A0AA38M780_9CUCU|nr:hypothetical protein Zmor_023251 [Zophobas morio]
METPAWHANREQNAFHIARFRIRDHLHQWYSVSEIIVPSNLKLTIVAMLEQIEHCKLKNKFCNASKKSPTSALANLQLKLGLHSL